MDGFKDSTRTMYSMGGSAYAKGGSAKGGSKDMAQDKATASTAVHKHERALHKGAPMTKLAKGGRVFDFIDESGMRKGAFGELRDVESSALGTGIGPNNLSGVLGNALAAKVARTGLGNSALAAKAVGTGIASGLGRAGTGLGNSVLGRIAKSAIAAKVARPGLRNALAAKVAGTGLASGLRRAGTGIVAGDSATVGAGGRSRMPSAGAAVESGNRMSAMENREAIMLEREAMANQMRARQAMAKKRAAMRPSVGAAVESGNRMSAMENREAVMLAKQAIAERMGMGAMSAMEARNAKGKGMGAMTAMEAAEARFMDKNMAMGGGVKKAMHGGAVKKAMGGAVKKAMGKKDC